LFVDYSALGACRSLQLTDVPWVFLCFRVFALGSADLGRVEAEAVGAAALVVGLSQPDAVFLRSLAPCRAVAVIHPPLRADVAQLAAAAAPATPQPRALLTCAVRLSPEKQPERFVELVEALARRGALARLGLQPALVGCPRDAWGSSLVQRLLCAAPTAEVHTDFLSPAQLGSLWCRTLLNIHPPSYDAFGMTALEAAAWGAPSLMHLDGVGAAEVLRPDLCLSVAMDLSQPAEVTAAAVEALAHSGALPRMGDAARLVAFAHTEASCAAALLRELRAICGA
jgi:glycosyltransferase involved in cell wall biosynthesis